MMFALIPVKLLSRAKQRLAGALDGEDRPRLSEAMLHDVLSAITSQTAITGAAICSSDPSVAAIARAYGIGFIDEQTIQDSGLNAVVNATADRLAQEGVRSLMVIHGDLPLLTAEELGIFVSTHLSAGERAVTLTPDRHYDGTNLLAWNPGFAFTAAYGPGSFNRHTERAVALGLNPVICELAGAAFDIDYAEDFSRLLELAPVLNGVTGKLLRELFKATPSCQEIAT
jgi:2-phospho-L-lactate guanylyltransferase